MNYDRLYDWCEHFVHFYDVSEELSDIGVTVEEIEKAIDEAVEEIRKEITE